MWLSGMRNVPAIELRTPIWCLTCFRSGRVAGSTSQTSSKPASAMGPNTIETALYERHLREKRSFRRYSRPTRIAIGTQRGLPENRKPETLPDSELRRQAQLFTSHSWPPIWIRRCVLRSANRVRILIGRLGHYQPAPDLEERCRAFGSHRWRTEASRENRGKARPVSLVSSKLFGSSMHDFHPGRQLELAHSPLQELNGAAR